MFLVSKIIIVTNFIDFALMDFSKTFRFRNNNVTTPA